MKHRYWGYASCYVIMFASILTTYVVSGVHSIGMTIFTDPNYGKYLYFKPWIRISAYQVGIIFGLWYYEWMNRKKCSFFRNTIGTVIFEKVQNSRVVRYALYLTGFVIINFLIFIQHLEFRNIGGESRYFSQFISNLFNAFSRPLFVGSLGMIMMGPLVGKSKFLRFVLGSKGYATWGKLTFMVYMIHLIILSWFYSQIRQGNYLAYKPVFFTLVA
mmetsp:Transcript_12855/g.14704  ORF Transcript_12855/g.14704 Transcript_12855/m.14704 type:complete len:216 (+) Transcript_12855:950-1597(+)